MDSREMGLVLGQQLLGIEDLHYGLWDGSLELTLANLPLAQQRYTQQLLSALPAIGDEPVHVLDIGCGTGHILEQCLKMGYLTHGVSPSSSLSRMIRKRLETLDNMKAKLFECRFEDFPADKFENYYDAVFFSESFQYIPMQAAFDIIKRILKPGGTLIICDFFKTGSDGDGRTGDGSFGGGHSMSEFYKLLDSIPFTLIKDEDITKKVSPNLELLNDILMNRMQPASKTMGTWLHGRHRFLYWLITTFFRKQLKKIRYKYFSGHRNKQTFERYKSYHMLVFSLDKNAT